MEFRFLEIVLGMVSLVAGGGWFVNWKTNRDLKRTEVIKDRLNVYISMLDDTEVRIQKLQNKIKELESQCDNCSYKNSVKREM